VPDPSVIYGRFARPIAAILAVTLRVYRLNSVVDIRSGTCSPCIVLLSPRSDHSRKVDCRMFDAKIRALIDAPLNAMGRQLASLGVTANTVTFAGFFLGMTGVALIVAGYPAWALMIIFLSRLADGLDGAVARASRKTDLGGFLDIVLDFIFYGAVPLGFAIADPQTNALPAAVLLLSYFANGSTFLAYAIMAEKQAIQTTAQGVKSLYYMSGLAEGGETILAIILFCLFPQYFPWIAYAYAGLCYASAVGRIVLACKTLK